MDEELLPYLISHPSKSGLKADQNEKLKEELIFGPINRKQIKLSSIPLGAIFNDKIDQIKKFESDQDKSIAPIQIQLLNHVDF